MTERFVANKGSEGLTSKTLAPKLEMQGVIFMPDGSTAPETQQSQLKTLQDRAVETPQPSLPETSTLPNQEHPFASPEAQKKAKENWAKLNEGRTPSADEILAQNKAAELGISPAGGGAEILPEQDFQGHPILLGIVKEINWASRGGEPLDLDFINDQRMRLRSHLDSGQVDPELALRLINRLNDLAKEAQRIQALLYKDSKGDGYFSGQDRIGILTSRDRRNQVFNDIFAEVDAKPHLFWNEAFNIFTHGMMYERFTKLIMDGYRGTAEGIDLTEQQRADLEADFNRYQTERRVREILHNANAVLYQPSIKADQLYDYIQQFSSDLGDFAYKIPGVKQMLDLYEHALRENMMKNDGYLEPEAVVGKIKTVWVTEPGGEKKETITEVSKGETEVQTKARFKQLLDQGKITIRTNEGDYRQVGKLQDWEIDRIFTISKGMLTVSLRIASLAAESRLPEKTGRWTSLFLQDVLQGYSPYIHLITKYSITESGLVAYLYMDGKEQEITVDDGLLGLLTLLFAKINPRWSTHELKSAYKKFEDDALKMIYSSKGMRYLMRLNPNRAGDIFTWLSWRATESPTDVSMTRDFIAEGAKRMVARFKTRYNIPETTDFEKRRQDINYESYLTNEQKKKGGKISQEDIVAINAYAYSRSDQEIGSEKARTEIGKIKEYFNEYGNWIGTGLRFERLRGGLSTLKEDLRDKKADKREKAEKTRKSANVLLERMAKLQPHRLYLISREIRERIKLTEEQKQNLSKILNNLSLAETSFLQDREKLLDSVINENNEITFKTFNTAALDSYFSAIQNETEREQAKEFAEMVYKDFESNKDKYWDEFVENREYKHGFVLWSGDAPVDEFNVTAIGPTAGFARRARDNKAQGEAIGEELKLLGHLKSIKDPDQLMEALQGIYDKVSQYDTGKAKQAIAEKAEGLIKFYLADFWSYLPIIGPIKRLMGKASFSQLVYGKTAMVMTATQARYMIIQLRDKKMIDESGYNRLIGKTKATVPDVGFDLLNTFGQFAIVALALYLLEKLKEK